MPKDKVSKSFSQDKFTVYGDIPMHRSVQESQQCDLLCRDGEKQQLGTNNVPIIYLCQIVVIRDKKVLM
jgi:hypothetical protein